MQTIPKTMRAAAIDHFGGPEVLSIHSLPVPVPDAREVLIAVDTAGVASWDADMREGWSPTGHTRFPLVLGTDGGGTVAALGSRVRRFKVGDRVYAYSFDNPKGGFYAEYVAVLAEVAGDSRIRTESSPNLGSGAASRSSPTTESAGSVSSSASAVPWRQRSWRYRSREPTLSPTPRRPTSASLRGTCSARLCFGRARALLAFAENTCQQWKDEVPGDEVPYDATGWEGLTEVIIERSI
jgi:Alcohol dehydrogenase GroES-like domain